MSIFKQISNTTLSKCVPIVALAFISSTASASLVSTANIEFDDFNSFGDTQGAFRIIENGATTSVNFAGDTADQNTLSGNIVSVGDGILFNGGVSGLVDAEYLIGIDAEINLSNTSLTDIYELTFQLDFLNSVNASGDDAFADSELTIEDEVSELFFTDLTSDSFFGNEVGGNETGEFGGLVSATGMVDFTITLAPGDVFDFFFSFTQDGGEFTGGGEVNANLTQSFTLISSVITNAPEPNPVSAPISLLFVLLGATGIFYRKHS